MLDDLNDETPTTPVDVYLSGGLGQSRGLGYVWNAEDAFRVREEFRLLGDFVGTLPKHCSQNQFLSLPLVLSYDELLFGFEHGYFRLLSDSPLLDYAMLSSSEAATASKQFYKEREADCDRQAEVACAIQAIEREKHLAKSIAQSAVYRSRRQAGCTGAGCDIATNASLSHLKHPTSRKRVRGGESYLREVAEQPPLKARKIDGEGILARLSNSFWSALHRLIPSVVADPYTSPSCVLPKEGIGERRRNSVEGGYCDDCRQLNTALEAHDDQRNPLNIEKAFEQARASATIVTCTEARDDERKSPREVYEVPRPLGVSDRLLSLRQIVFRDLHNKGYYMSCGAKFGADFLAYAGEPLLYHAALAVIVTEADDKVSAHDVIALGRLGDSTKKRTVLAFVDEYSPDSLVVRYVGIQWEENLP